MPRSPPKTKFRCPILECGTEFTWQSDLAAHMARQKKVKCPGRHAQLRDNPAGRSWLKRIGVRFCNGDCTRGLKDHSRWCTAKLCRLYDHLTSKQGHDMSREEASHIVHLARNLPSENADVGKWDVIRRKYVNRKVPVPKIPDVTVPIAAPMPSPSTLNVQVRALKRSWDGSNLMVEFNRSA